MQQQFSPRRLREAREAAGHRREAIAVQVDRSYETVAAYELGRVMPPAPILAQLAGLYGCRVDDFFELVLHEGGIVPARGDQEVAVLLTGCEVIR